MIAELARATFGYFDRQTNPANGLVRDNTKPGSPASIAGTGHALACYPIAAARGYLTRGDAASRTVTALRFLCDAEQSDSTSATGFHGFFYHFLDWDTGARVDWSELSTLDSALLFAGALTAAAYFDGDDATEREIRTRANALYLRADWQWASPRAPAVSHGWRPGRGFLPYDYRGYSEALLLYVLALGSPTFPVPASAYDEWTSEYKWRTIYGQSHLFAGPLFIHQISHLWIDFRGIRDAYMRSHDLDYFENSRRATYVQQEYARRNPRGFAGYDALCWGITASDGPGPTNGELAGKDQKFWNYRSRGVPYGPDDGTLSPWGVAASLPFAPEIVLPTLAAINARHPTVLGEHGYRCSLNPSFESAAGGTWVSSSHFAIDQGPVVMAIENHRSQLVWTLMRGSEHIVRGLRRAGFSGGWLEGG
jgi:hypothetical protein